MIDSDKQGLRARKKQQAQQTIVDVSRRMVHERGVAQTRMRDIARSAGLSYQTLYNYFPSKGQLFLALLARRQQQTAADLQTIVRSPQGGLLATLNQLVRRSLASVTDEDRPLWRVVVQEQFDRAGYSIPIYRLIDGAARENLRQLLTQARRSGELTAAADAEQLADVLFHLTDHSLLRYIHAEAVALDSAADRLSAEIRVVVSPRLTQRRSGRTR
jgi:AcrR family transcriptional regulator